MRLFKLKISGLQIIGMKKINMYNEYRLKFEINDKKEKTNYKPLIGGEIKWTEFNKSYHYKSYSLEDEYLELRLVDKYHHIIGKSVIKLEMLATGVVYQNIGIIGNGNIEIGRLYATILFEEKRKILFTDSSIKINKKYDNMIIELTIIYGKKSKKIYLQLNKNIKFDIKSTFRELYNGYFILRCYYVSPYELVYVNEFKINEHIKSCDDNVIIFTEFSEILSGGLFISNIPKLYQKRSNHPNIGQMTETQIYYSKDLIEHH